MDYNSIYKRVENFVRGLYEKYGSDNLHFHNLKHTEKVVERAREIATKYDLSPEHQCILYTAAWFHDTGHLFVDPAMHEVKSAELMKNYCIQLGLPAEFIKEVEDCIMSTKIPRNPQNSLQEILCDADTYHLGTKEFKSTNKQIKKEYSLRKIKSPNTNWNVNALEFLEGHKYYTEYARDLLEKEKAKNMEKLKRKIAEKAQSNGIDEIPVISGGPLESPDKNKIQEKLTPANNNNNNNNDKEKEKDKEKLVDKDKDKDKEKDKVTDKDKEKEKDVKAETKQEVKQQASLLSKGIQTMLRLTSDNHLELSGMADGKANILISVNSIIISVILTVLLRRLEIDTHLTIPTIIFLTFSVGTIVIAILATRPKISQGKFSREDILNKQTNLLFFGNFHKASFEEYEWGMREMMKDQDYLYGTLIKDIFNLGVVLGRKYKLIRLAYTVFMVGIIVSVLAFSIAVWYNRVAGGSANSSAMPL